MDARVGIEQWRRHYNQVRPYYPKIQPSAQAGEGEARTSRLGP
jgi:hypothetical protein